MTASRCVLFVTVLWVAGCGGPPPPPFKPVADVKQIMAAIIDPEADVVWASVGTIIDEKGITEIEPRTQEEWDAVRNAAWTITESGNLLMIGARPRDSDEWMRMSQALIEVGHQVVRAAENKDKEAIFQLGGDLYNVCTNCHEKYNINLRQ